MSQPQTAKRVCQIIKVFYWTVYRIKIKIDGNMQLKPSAVSEYKAVHAAVWPSVLSTIKRCNIIDYSIYHYAPLQLLIATFKYIGDDYAADMNKMGEDAETRKWWAMTDGMQESFVDGATGSGGNIPWWQVRILGL